MKKAMLKNNLFSLTLILSVICANVAQADLEFPILEEFIFEEENVDIFPADFLVQVGLKHYQKGEYEMALREFNKALLMQPGNQDAKRYAHKIKSERMNNRTDFAATLKREQTMPNVQATRFAHDPSIVYVTVNKDISATDRDAQMALYEKKFKALEQEKHILASRVNNLNFQNTKAYQMQEAEALEADLMAIKARQLERKLEDYEGSITAQEKMAKLQSKLNALAYANMKKDVELEQMKAKNENMKDQFHAHVLAKNAMINKLGEVYENELAQKNDMIAFQSDLVSSSKYADIPSVDNNTDKMHELGSELEHLKQEYSLLKMESEQITSPYKYAISEWKQAYQNKNTSLAKAGYSVIDTDIATARAKHNLLNKMDHTLSEHEKAVLGNIGHMKSNLDELIEMHE